MMIEKINKKTLKKNEWNPVTNPVSRKIITYHKGIKSSTGKQFYCELQMCSNTVGRDWYVHVDNEHFESVGNMDVATFDQIERFLELLSE